ncbi:MAG TPA: ABC transporter permease subunit [Actinomycetota bacterium]|nr:ABC transporter permease subunit [Actinomycetota bacterium]
MELLGDVWLWFTTASSWTGEGIDPGILFRIYEHMSMSLQAAALAAALVLPLGLYVGHARRFEFAAVTVGNFGRALPSFGILGITFAITISWPGNLGFWATFIALLLLAIPPILTNTYVGVKGVDADTIEAARGMGMTEMQILLRIEVPLAAPLIVAGLRLATVQVVATATLGAVAAWGGLGRYIVDGFASGNDVDLLGGAILVAVLAIVTELAFGLVERLVRPRTAARAAAPRPAGTPVADPGAAA